MYFKLGNELQKTSNINTNPLLAILFATVDNKWYLIFFDELLHSCFKLRLLIEDRYMPLINGITICE